MPVPATSRAYSLLIVPIAILLTLSAGLQESRAQDIRTRLTAFDNVGNSTNLHIGIVASATDGIDPALGEEIIPPPAPNTWDARLIDTDFRSPSILGSGVLRDFRGIFTAPPIDQQFEIRVRRDPLASTTWLRWNLPLATGISSLRIVSYPDPSILDVDMSTTAQIELPVGTNKYFIFAVYGDPPPTRYTLNVEIDPPGKGQVVRVPFQLDYAPGDPVLLAALNLPEPDTCYTFSHWSGDAMGTNSILNISMTRSKTIIANYAPRTFPVTVTELDTFVVDIEPPPAQKIHILNSGLACYTWTATATAPWIRLSKSFGTGDDSIRVEIITSAVPCPGTHAGTVEITSPFSSPETIQVPVILRIGRVELTAEVVGNPSILSCQSKAADLITVTIRNEGVQDVVFSQTPDLGEGFVLKNPGVFPMTVLPRDVAKLYVEFAPTATQRGTIIENIILSADECGQEVLFQLSGTRFSPTVTADVMELDFGLINNCDAEDLPQRSINLDNAFTDEAILRYNMPSGFRLVSGPTTLAGGSTAEVVLEAARSGAESFDTVIGIEADFGICAETFSIRLHGQRQRPSFFAEAMDTPGQLPPQLYDTTCVGTYSAAKRIRLYNDGTAELLMSIDVDSPFEVDAFSNVFPLRPGEERIVPIRFHPLASGTFERMLTISANLCELEASVTLRGSTFSQQILTSTVAPTHITLADCELSGKVQLRIVNTGSEPVRFEELPDLPYGFGWGTSIKLPVIIQPNPSSPFEVFLNFEPPIGEGGTFGGSVQWFGMPCGSTVFFSLSGERILPQVSITPNTVDFGKIVFCGDDDISPSRVINIMNNSPLPITLNALASTAKYEIRYGPNPFPTQGVNVNANTSVEIDVFAKAGSGGMFNDTLQLEIIAGTGGFCREYVPIVLLGERYEPRFMIRENGYSNNFGDVCVNGNAIRSYVVENTGDKRMTVSSEAFHALSPFQLLEKPFKITLQPGGFREFPVRYNPLQVGADAATLYFTSDVCPDTVSFTFRGRGVQPSFAVTSVTPPDAISILSCEEQLSRQIRATVQNTGGTPVTITDGSLLPRGFIYDPPLQFPFTLQADQTRDIIIRFTGTEAGSYSGMVTLYGSPCDVTDAFAVQARIVHTTYATAPENVDFGMITICPGGSIRPGDIERLRRTVEFRNTGEIPLTIDANLNPHTTPVVIASPLTWPVIVPAGQVQTLVLELRPPFGEGTSQFNGVLELRVTRDQRCPQETRVVPLSGQVNHLAYAFVRDSIHASATCSTEPVEFYAELANSGITPIALEFRIQGSRAFTLPDDQPLVLPAGQRRSVRIIYTPSNGEPSVATLIASENICGSEIVVPLRVLYEQATLTLSGSATGLAPSLSARPGDMIEIPLYLNQTFQCPSDGVTMQYELQFDRRSLAPDRVTSAQGVASFTRPTPDKIIVTISGASFTQGEVARVTMEVLVGRTASTQWTMAAAVFAPGIALLTTDESCNGMVTIRPRNGVTTLSDLGITTLNPPRPNLVGGNSASQTLISFSLKNEAFVDVKIFDILGVETGIIHSGQLKAGKHSVRYSTSHLRAGVYFVLMTTDTYRSIQKLIVAN